MFSSREFGPGRCVTCLAPSRFAAGAKTSPFARALQFAQLELPFERILDDLAQVVVPLVEGDVGSIAFDSRTCQHFRPVRGDIWEISDYHEFFDGLLSARCVIVVVRESLSGVSRLKLPRGTGNLAVIQIIRLFAFSHVRGQTVNLS